MHKSIASIALIRREAESQTLWLARWDEGSKSYGFVGGHKQDHESFRECLIREIGEDLGLHEGRDVLVASAPLEHLEYTEVSRSTGEQTEYIIELFDVALTGSGTRSTIDANPAYCWLSEPEIMAEACNDDRPISSIAKRFLNKLGWDLFISYAHQDDQPDAWVTALVKAIRAAHAELTPTPLRVFFNHHEIRELDDWQHRNLQGMLASKLMLAVMSEEYFRSPYCRKEWQFYRNHETHRQLPGVSIVPIYVVSVPALDGPATMRANEWQTDLMQRLDLQRRLYLDVRQWRPHGIRALGQSEIRQRLRSLDQQLCERLARARRAGESRHTVPRASDRFVGRHAELARLRAKLLQGKIAAVTAVQGIRGIGKTALAFFYSQAFADDYPGGRYLVDAAGLTDLRVVMTRLAADLGLAFNEFEQKDPDLAAARVRTVLEQSGRALLVLENVEHVELLQPPLRSLVLPATDRLHVLVTTRIDQQQIADSAIECLELQPLPEHDALELLNRHRALQGDEEWNAALRLARFLGCHTLAIEVVAVYLWKHPEIAYCQYLSGLESAGVFAALTATSADRAVQLSAHSQKLIGQLLEPTLAGLSMAELRVIEYAALLSPDAVALPWLCELVAADFPQVFAARPGDVDPWRDLEWRLTGLRLWTRSAGENLVRMHRIVQEVARARISPKILEQRRTQIRQYVLRRAESFAGSASLGTSSWEVEPLRDYALLSMSADDPSAMHVGQWLSQPLHDLGRVTDAGILARAAVACSQRLAAADPGNAERQRDMSVSQDNIGNVLSAQGDLTGALAAYRASLEISRRLAAADPGNADLQRDLSVSHNNIGNVLSAKRDLTAALVAYRASHKIFEQLSATDPGNIDWQFDLSVSQEKIGDVLSAKRDLTAALVAYRASHEIFERLAAADPGNADWQRDLSVSREKIGDVLNAQGHPTAALTAYRASLESRQRLAATDWGNTGLQRDLSISQDNIGHVLSAQGDLNSALVAFRASLEIRQRLAAADRGNADRQRDLSVSHDNIGSVLRAQRDLTPALAAYRASLEIRQRLAATDPGNAGWQRDLSVAHNKVGDVLSAQGDLNAALEAYHASLEIRQRLAEADPRNTGWQRDLSVSQEKIGDVRSAQGDLNAALATYRTCLEIRERLAATDPVNAGWQHDLSVSQGKTGDVLSRQGDLNAAMAIYWASLEIRQQLAATDPLNLGLQRDLSVSQGKIGDMLSAQGDLTAALVAYRASLEIRQRLAATDPGNASWQRDLWVSFWRLATTTEQQDTDEARIWWQEACDVLSAMKQRGMFVSRQDEQYRLQLRSRLSS